MHLHHVHTVTELHSDWIWQTLREVTLITSAQGEFAHCFPGQCVPVLDHIHCGNISEFFSPVFKKNFQYFLLCSLPTVLQLVTSKKNLPLSSSHTCLHNVNKHCGSPPEQLFLRPKAPRSFTLSFYDRWSKTCVILMALCLLPSCAVHYVHVSSELGSPVMKQQSDESHQCWVETKNHFTWLSGNALTNAAQEDVGMPFHFGVLCLLMNSLNAQVLSSQSVSSLCWCLCLFLKQENDLLFNLLLNI